MGGDQGPKVVVPGAVQAAREGDLDVTLVGDEAAVHSILDGMDNVPKGVSIQHASQVVAMGEKPADAMRRKKDSSVRVACELVKEGFAHGVVSAGNSGATVAGGVFVLGRIKGVERPALAGVLPTEKDPLVLIDVGANVDSKPYNLVQFGIMADVLSRTTMGVARPRVGLLTIGEEEGKGNTMVKGAFELFKQSSLNFVGNVEGRQIFTGEVDVVVCDGFVGNVALKLSEGITKSMGSLLKRELTSGPFTKFGAFLARASFRRFKKTTDPNEYGGAPLLGVNGMVLVCHGAASSKGIQRAVEMAGRFTRENALDQLAKGMEAHSDLAKFGRNGN